MDYNYTVRVPVVSTRLATVYSSVPLTDDQVRERIDVLDLHENSCSDIKYDINYAFLHKLDIDNWEVEEEIVD